MFLILRSKFTADYLLGSVVYCCFAEEVEIPTSKTVDVLGNSRGFVNLIGGLHDLKPEAW
jgi:hypothetical protein